MPGYITPCFRCFAAEINGIDDVVARPGESTFAIILAMSLFTSIPHKATRRSPGEWREVRATLALTTFLLSQCVLPQSLALRGVRADELPVKTPLVPTPATVGASAPSLDGVKLTEGTVVNRSSLAKVVPSPELWSPNDYTSVIPLDLSNEERVPTEQEVSGQGAMCGGLAPAAPAEPQDVEDEVDEILRNEGFEQGLKTKFPTVEEAQALVARRVAPASLLVSAQRLEDGKKKVRKARKQNRDFALAMLKWNRTDFVGADKALRAYVKEFSKKSKENQEGSEENSPWLPEALIHIADLAKFNGQLNEAEENYKKVLEMTSSNTSEMSYEAHLKAYERWADLYILEGRFAEARPMLASIVQDDVHWRRRTWAQYWTMQLNALYAGSNFRFADLDCGTKALAALLVDLNQSRDARRVASIEAKSDKGFSLAELKTIALKQKVAMVGFRATPAALVDIPLPALLHYSPSADAQAQNDKVLKTSTKPRQATSYGHYVVVRAYDAERGVWSILNPQSGTQSTLNQEQLAKEWSGAGLMLTKQPRIAANTPVQERSRWLALWPNRKSDEVYKQVARRDEAKVGDEARDLARLSVPAPSQAKLSKIALLSPDEMRQIVGTCYVVHANSQNGQRPYKINACPGSDCGNKGEPSVSIDPVDQNIFVADTPVWYNPARGPQVEFNMFYNSLLASNYNGTIGNKWTHNYGAFLTEMPNQVTRFGGDGSQDVYTFSNGAYVAPKGVYNKLFKTGTLTFYMESQEGDREYYGIPAGLNSTVPVLLKQRDRWGQELTIQYRDSNGKILINTITDADGGITNFTHFGTQLAAVRVPDGRTARFYYDGNGNLSQCTDVAGQNFYYYYDNMVVLTGLNTPQGNWQFISEVQPYTAGNNGYNQIRVIDPSNGSPMIIRYDNRVHGTGTYSYTDRRGYETTYGVQSIGGIGVINRITTPTGYTQSLTFDPDDPYQPTEIQTPHTTSTLQYNAQGNLFHTTSRDNSANNNRSLSIGYNGIDVQSVNASAYNIGYVIGQGLGTAYYNAKHQPTTVYDPAGNKTQFDYTTWGAPLTVTTFQGNTGAQLDHIRYYYGTQTGWDYNRLVQIRKNTKLQASFTYDSAGRVMTMTDARGITVGYQYNALDKVTQTTYPDNTSETVQYAWFSLPAVVTDRSGRVTAYGRDKLKRLTSVKDADNKTIIFAYDREGNRTSLRDARGFTTQWQYDGDGRPTLKTYADGKTEQWNYNNTDGRLVNSVNARNQTTFYSYNAWDEVYNINYPTTTDTTFGHDGLGRLTMMSDSSGTTSWLYDTAGRPYREDGPWSSDNVETSYDSRNNVSQTRVDSGTGQDMVNYGYDTIGRLNQVSATTGKWGNVTGVRGGTWDLTYVGWSQMPLTENRPNGGYSEWNYEGTGLQRLTRVSNKVGPSTAVLSRFTYGYGSIVQGNTTNTLNLDNRTAVGKQYGDNAGQVQTTTYSYNATSMLTLEWAKTAGNAQTPQLYRGHTFDAMGNRTAFNYNYPLTNGTSTYNNVNQLTQTDLPTTNQTAYYDYDNDGNTIAAYNTYNAVSLPAFGSIYTYDEASRLTAIDTKNNLAAPVSDTRTEFVYDGLSRLRISRYYTKQSNGQLALQNEKRRVYDGMDIVQERDANNVVTASITRTGNIGGILARTTGAGNAGSTFYGYDGAGNVVTLTNGAGAEVGSYTYDAWGNTVASSGAMAGENPYRFSTKEQIGGLYSYGYRFYSPGIGRWINRDPIGEAGGINLYGFVGNDPANMVDFYGLTTFASGIEIGGAIGPLNFSVSAKQVVGFSKQGVSVGLIFTPSFGVGAGAEAHVQAFGEVTDAYGVRDIEATSFEVGGSGGAGVSGAIDLVSSGDPLNPNTPRGVKAGLGVGGGLGAHGMLGYGYGLSTPIIPWPTAIRKFQGYNSPKKSTGVVSKNGAPSNPVSCPIVKE